MEAIKTAREVLKRVNSVKDFKAIIMDCKDKGISYIKANKDTIEIVLLNGVSVVLHLSLFLMSRSIVGKILTSILVSIAICEFENVVKSIKEGE